MSSIKLNENQIAAVKYDKNNALLIEAGPGAGKTRVIIERIKFLINEKKINPESLLIITFSNKAAEELKNRLIKDIPQEILNKMQISTIHSFCYKLLKEESTSQIAILDDDFQEKNKMFIKKHLKDLGFIDESYFSQSDVDVLVSKYDEFTTFKIKINEFIDYLEENFKVDNEYINFINEFKEDSIANLGYFKFPKKEVKDNELFKSSWFNARYIQVAKSYEKYLELLSDNNLLDFSLLQVKALEFLKENNDLKYKNILVDEFQDTDPTQIEIFKLLNENADSFTCVGDDDQSIYGFRGSSCEFFNDFKNIFNGEIIELDTNYRSCKEIVEFCENFIKNDRLNKNKKLKFVRDFKGNTYKITSKNKNEEAIKIANLIKHLKETKKITNYSDVGLLFRSISSFNKSKLDDLTGELKNNNIPYFIKGNPDLSNQIEIKLFLFLLHYLIEDDVNNYLLSKWEDEWLNLNFFKSNSFLSKKTQDIFSNIEEDYRSEVLEKEKEIYFKVTGKNSRIKNFNGVFKRDEDIIAEIFETVNKPFLSKYKIDDLINLGIDDRDLEFFKNLIELKEKIEYHENNHGDIDPDDKLTLLDVFYQLIEITHELKTYFTNQNQNTSKLFNLGLITNTIYNYEYIIGKNIKNLSGLYFFLFFNIESYSSALENCDDAVQIMTVHKSKGLEFKVLIVCSLEDKKFPSEFKESKSGFKPNFHVPDEFYEFSKNVTYETHLKEERRILYVAMTRAEDVLILSTVKNPPELDGIDFNSKNIIEINDFETIPYLEKSDNKKITEPIDLSYTSLNDYEKCPKKYDLVHNFNLSYSDNSYITRGVEVHLILDKINKIAKDISLDEKKEIIKSFSKDENDKKHIENIIYYFENYDIDVIASEMPFSINYKDFVLSGQIDLVYKTKDGQIGLLDYKNMNSINKKEIKKQLLTYCLAIKNNSEFDDLAISELSVYLVKAQRWINIEFSNEDIKNYEKHISKIASLIRDKKFLKNESYECKNCEFDFICN